MFCKAVDSVLDWQSGNSSQFFNPYPCACGGKAGILEGADLRREAFSPHHQRWLATVGGRSTTHGAFDSKAFHVRKGRRVFLETRLFERGPIRDPDPSLTITTVLFSLCRSYRASAAMRRRVQIFEQQARTVEGICRWRVFILGEDAEQRNAALCT